MEKSYVGMTNCYFCGEGKDILIDRRLKNSLPQYVGVLDMEPCNKCKEYMEQGIIVMSIKDDTTPEEMGKGGTIPNPYRTGGWVVVKEEAVKNFLNGDMLDFALEKRFLFVVDSAWDMLGLPR